jgi:hypothetical protein
MLSADNAGRPMTILDIAGLVGQAFPLTLTPSNILAGVRVSGTWPFNRDVFGDDEFLPSHVTDRPMPVAGSSVAVNNDQPFPAALETTDVARDKVCETLLIDNNTAVQQPSTPGPSQQNNDRPSTSKAFVTPEQIRPFAKAAPLLLTLS